MEVNTVLKEHGLSYDTPLAMMTIGQLLEVAMKQKNTAHFKGQREYLYGIRGIRQEFGVSHKTAQAWKNTWLAPAIEQTGKVILCDKAMAHELFKARKEGRK